MALSVAPVNNPTFLGMGSSNSPKISGVISATPGSNGFLGLSNPATSGAGVKAAQTQANSTTSSINALLAQIQALTNAQQKQVYAPALDYKAISAQARQQAEAAVNPYYTKQLNDFLTQQSVQKQQQQVAHDTAVQNLQDQLAATLKANETTGARTTADVAQNEADVNQATDEFQTDNGQTFAGDRIAQAHDLAAKGLTGGLGAQAAETATATHNTTEKRQVEQADKQKQAQELLKSRTFEDLATSGTLASTAKEKGVKQTDVDLADFIENQGLELTSKQSELAHNKESDILNKASSISGGLVQDFINSIANPAQRQAAMQAYGGLM